MLRCMDYRSRPRNPESRLLGWLLGRAGLLGIPFELLALRNRHPQRRIAAARRLADWRIRLALPHLIEMAQAPEWAIRAAGVECLALYDDPALAPQVTALMFDADGSVRRAAMWGIARLAPLLTQPELRDPVIERLFELLEGSASSGDRQTAAWGLTQLATNGEEARQVIVDRLLILLKQPEAGARWAAVYTLKGIPERRALEPLFACLEGSDPDLALAAADALEALARRQPDGKLLRDRVDAWRKARLREQLGAEVAGPPA